MIKNYKRILFWVAISLAGLLLVGNVALLTWKAGLPFRLAQHYSMEELTETAILMDECAECHAGQDFHRCSTCHDDHGAVEFAGLPFFKLITFNGDVPQPGYVQLNQILPYRDHPNTHIQVEEFLSLQGVDDFESVTLTSLDGGFVTIDRENLTDQALLLPFSDGIRFASEDLHVSTWLKGITDIIVVGHERDFDLNGEMTSIGRLLLGPTREVTVQSARVMLASETDGQIREAWTASRMWGVSLADLVGAGDLSSVVVSTQGGELVELGVEEAASAVLVSEAGGPVLVLPDRSRSGWIAGVSGLSWGEN